jgi:hypothetical protein
MDYSSVEKVASVYQWAMEKRAINPKAMAGFQAGRLARMAGETEEKAAPAMSFLKSRLTGRPVTPPSKLLSPSGLVQEGPQAVGLTRASTGVRFAKPGVS